MGRDGDRHLDIDKRTISGITSINSATTLEFAKDLPVKCNDCPYRAREEMGNGICVQYEKDALCSVRKDIRQKIAEYRTRSPDQIIPLMKEEFDSNYEMLKFCEQMEKMSGKLDSETTKRINALNSLGKTLNELMTTKTTVEMSETKTLSPEKKDEIAKMIKITKQQSELK